MGVGFHFEFLEILAGRHGLGNSLTLVSSSITRTAGFIPNFLHRATAGRVSGQPLQHSRAVADAFGGHVHSLQHGQKQIGHGRVLGDADVPARLQGAATAARQQHGQIVMRVFVAICETTAIDDHALVEQRAIAFPDRLGLNPHGRQTDVNGVSEKDPRKNP